MVPPGPPARSPVPRDAPRPLLPGLQAPVDASSDPALVAAPGPEGPAPPAGPGMPRPAGPRAAAASCGPPEQVGRSPGGGFGSGRASPAGCVAADRRAPEVRCRTACISSWRTRGKPQTAWGGGPPRTRDKAPSAPLSAPGQGEGPAAGPPDSQAKAELTRPPPPSPEPLCREEAADVAKGEAVEGAAGIPGASWGGGSTPGPPPPPRAPTIPPPPRHSTSPPRRLCHRRNRPPASSPRTPLPRLDRTTAPAHERRGKHNSKNRYPSSVRGVVRSALLNGHCGPRQSSPASHIANTLGLGTSAALTSPSG